MPPDILPKWSERRTPGRWMRVRAGSSQAHSSPARRHNLKRRRGCGRVWFNSHQRMNSLTSSIVADTLWRRARRDASGQYCSALADHQRSGICAELLARCPQDHSQGPASGVGAQVAGPDKRRERPRCCVACLGRPVRRHQVILAPGRQNTQRIAEAAESAT